VGRAGGQVGDRQDGGIEDVDLAGDRCLQREDDLRGDRDRVGREVRRGCVATTTMDRDREVVGRRLLRARPTVDGA